MEQRSLYLVRQALNAIFKRRRLVLLVFLLVLVPSNVGNLLKDSQYRANAKLLIKNARTYPEVSPLAREASVNRPPNETSINSEIQLIRSRDLLRRVHFELAAQASEAGDDPTTVPSVATLERKVSVSRKPNSNVVEVAYADSNEERAITIVNTLVRLYVEYHIEQNKQPGASEFFYTQARAAKQAYEESDVELEQYDAAHGLTSITVEKDQMLRQRAQLEADLRRSEAEIIELTTKVASLEAELEYIPEHEAIEVDMIPNPMLGYLRQNLAKLEMERNRLSQLYTPQHRLVMDVESEIAALRLQLGQQETSVIGRKKMATTPARRMLEDRLLTVQADLGALEARRSMTAERISDYDARIRVMHAKHYQVMRLRRDRTEKKQFYDELVQKLNQLQVSDAMDQAGLSNVAIVEAATAPLRTEPNFVLVTLVLSFFAALVISIGSAIVTEMLNPVMNSEIDIRHHLGLPVLAEIPRNGLNGEGEPVRRAGAG